jgi:hypothetical protein
MHGRLSSGSRSSGGRFSQTRPIRKSNTNEQHGMELGSENEPDDILRIPAKTPFPASGPSSDDGAAAVEEVPHHWSYTMGFYNATGSGQEAAMQKPVEDILKESKLGTAEPEDDRVAGVVWNLWRIAGDLDELRKEAEARNTNLAEENATLLTKLAALERELDPIQQVFKIIMHGPKIEKELQQEAEKILAQNLHVDVRVTQAFYLKSAADKPHRLMIKVASMGQANDIVHNRWRLKGKDLKILDELSKTELATHGQLWGKFREAREAGKQAWFVRARLFVDREEVTL